MAYERKQFQKAVEREAQEKARKRAPELRLAAQSTVPLDMLTHSEEWDYLLSILQDQVDTLAAAIESLQSASIADPSFEHAAMAQRKAAILQAAAQKATLEQVMALPGELLKKGKDAKFALGSLIDE